MDKEKKAISPPSTAFSASDSTPATASARTSHDRTPQATPHLYLSQHHLHPNHPPGRQARVPMQREPQHYPMAERCMCSSCHLSAKLFPRTDDGRIVLPIVPVAHSASNQAGGYTQGGDAVYVRDGGDLVQYMLAPGDGNSGGSTMSRCLRSSSSEPEFVLSYSGRPRPSSSSTAASSAIINTASQECGPSPKPSQRHIAGKSTSGATGGQQLDYAHTSSSPLDARMRNFGT
jgi:hypothetical protein